MRRFLKDSAGELYRAGKSETADKTERAAAPERKDFTIGWICPLFKENAAVFFDKQHQTMQSKGLNAVYSCGAIGEHNVVISGLPGDTGSVATANAVNELKNTFPNLRMILLVGVAGGAPTNKDKQDVRLGDVVVSMPNKHGPGIVQYDFGTDREHAPFEITNSFSGYPSTALVGAVHKVHREYEQSTETRNALGQRLIESVNEVANNHPNLQACRRPSLDQLFKTSYHHKENPSNTLCSECAAEDNALVTDRPLRELVDLPHVHHGLIASANTVLRNASRRDHLGIEMGVLCFEMEAAALSKSSMHWLVIRGICDYADSHKNKEWQEHAAAVAAQYATEVLRKLPAVQEGDLYENILTSHHSFFPERLNGNFVNRERKMQEISKCFKNQKESNGVSRTSIRGMAGCGKTQLAIKYCCERAPSYEYVFWLNADNPDVLDADVNRIVQEVSQNKKHPDMLDKAKSLKFIKNVFQDCKGPWLLVFDNFDRPNRFKEHDLAHYFPMRGNGEIMVTTQLQGQDLRTIVGNHIVEAEELERDEAYQIMFPDETAELANLHTTSTKASDDSDYDSEDQPDDQSTSDIGGDLNTRISSEDDKQAWQLLDGLGYHALSVDIAGGLIQNGCWTPERLLKKLGDSISPLDMGGHERYCKPPPGSNENHENGETKLIPGTPQIVCALALNELQNFSESESEIEGLLHFLAIVAQVIDYPIKSDWFRLYHERLLELEEVRPWMYQFTEKDQHGQEVWSEVKFLAKLQKLMDFTLIKKTRNHRESKTNGSFTMHPIMRDFVKRRISTFQADRAQLDIITIIWLRWSEPTMFKEDICLCKVVLNVVLGLPGLDDESIIDIKNGDVAERHIKYLAKVAWEDGYPRTWVELQFCKFAWNWLVMPIHHGRMNVLSHRCRQMGKKIFSGK